MKIARKEQAHTRTLIALVAVMVVVVLGVWAVQMYGMLSGAAHQVTNSAESGIGPENEAFLRDMKASLNTSDVDIGSAFATLKSEVQSAVVRTQLQADLAQKVQEQLSAQGEPVTTVNTQETTDTQTE